MKEIVSIDFKCEYDPDPDLSHLGEYSDKPEPGHIPRENVGRGEYGYFIPAMTGEETGNPDSPRQDYERMESYNRGEWYMCYCYAEAVVVVDGVRQKIRSAGLGGVESDSDKSYFDEVKGDELSSLCGILESLGWTKEEIAAKC